MEFVEAIIAYVDAKAELEVALRDPNVAICYDLHSVCWTAEAARKALLAFTEAIVDTAPGRALGILGQAVDEAAKKLADEMYEKREQRTSRKSPQGFLSSEDIAALTEANEAL